MPHSPVADWIRALSDAQLCAAVSLIVYPKEPVVLRENTWMIIEADQSEVRVTDYLNDINFHWLPSFVIRSGFVIFVDGSVEEVRVAIWRAEETCGTQGVIQRDRAGDCMARAFLEALVGYHESWIKFTDAAGTNTIAEAV